MDLTRIKNVVEKQLKSLSGIHSLQLQNHIYGCFLIMEDIAQKVLELSGDLIVGPRYRFDIRQQFSQIGIRYGFVMDGLAVLNPVPAEYQDAWIDLFRDIQMTQDIELVDRVEDTLNEVIQEVIPADEAFFIQASASGTLPQEWIIKAISLLHPSLITETVVEATVTKESQLPKAKAETGMHPSIHPRRFTRTRRHVSLDRVAPSALVKKGFARTRRNTSCV